MAEPRAQRTLVKSPPELWAEVSDVSALARHLGRFGEIRITRAEPETTVVWEGDRARGTVELEPSGWGTKVTLTAEVVAEERAAPESPAASNAVPEGPSAIEGSPPAKDPVVVEEPRRGFFARLFGRRRRPAAPGPPAPEPQPAAELEPAGDPGQEDVVAERSRLGDGDVEAVLVGVLDDLGSARHRPFSRG
jgi:hypothetical protein